MALNPFRSSLAFPLPTGLQSVLREVGDHHRWRGLGRVFRKYKHIANSKEMWKARARDTLLASGRTAAVNGFVVIGGPQIQVVGPFQGNQPIAWSMIHRCAMKVC